MRARVCKRCHAVVVGQCTCKAQTVSPTVKGYGRKWQRFREQVYKLRVRQGRALCAVCGLAFGGESPHADHIVPVKSADDPLFYVESNIQFLHPDCHGRKTASDVRRGATR